MSTGLRVPRETIGGAERWWNTDRPLTRSSDSTREGIAVQATTHTARSPRWRGHPRTYQSEAQRLFALDRQRVILPWSWIVTRCEVPMCLDTDCMTLHEATKIRYPAGTCVYCGDPAGTRDHLLPESLTGPVGRLWVLTVPACGNCNNRIGDCPSHCVTERRERAHDSIRKRSRVLLERPMKTPAEMRQLGHTLRTVALMNNRKAEWIKARLAWPDDPFYDLRAFQRSGIDDPEAHGLIRGWAA